MTRFIEPFQHNYFIEAREALDMWPKTIRYRDLSRKDQLAEERKKHQAELQRISKRGRR